VFSAHVIPAVLMFCPSLMGQQDKDELIQNLLSRVEVLEREVASLRSGSGSSAPQNSLAQQPTIATTVTAPPAGSADASDQQGGRFTLRGFADVDFLANQDGNRLKRFAVGELDLFATVWISPKVNVLMETDFDADRQVETGNVPISLERFLLQYKPNELLNVDLGAFRTAVGFYNTQYLRGSWFQTALTRPKLFTFEDDGGFLPLHTVGVSFSGKVPWRPLNLRYTFEFGNSRDYGHGSTTGLDLSHHSAVNVALSARPRSLPGLELGFSLYHDKFQTLALDRTVWAAHAVYQAHRVEVLNEAVLVRVQHPTAGHASIAGFYSQIAYRIGSNWSPYLRYESANTYGTGLVGDQIPQYVPWRDASVFGIRYDLTESIALKAEVARELDRNRHDLIRAALQVAFTF
jgi:hypothetical protein